MPSASFEGRPSISEEVIKRWPAPEGIRPARWNDLTYEAREAYLIEHAFEQSGERWVLREDTRDTAVSRQVLQAVSTAWQGPCKPSTYERRPAAKDWPLPIPAYTSIRSKSPSTCWA